MALVGHVSLCWPSLLRSGSSSTAALEHDPSLSCTIFRVRHIWSRVNLAPFCSLTSRYSFRIQSLDNEVYPGVPINEEMGQRRLRISDGGSR